MKKVLFGLLALSSLVAAKEIVPAPVAVVEAVCPEPVEYKEKEVLHNLYFRAGIDAWSEFNKPTWEEDPLNKEESKGLGWEVGMELTRFITPQFELGLGIAYQRHAKFKSEGYDIEYFDGGAHDYEYEADLNRFESIPLYLTAKYTFERDLFFAGWKPYVKADLGYSFNKGDKGTYSYYAYEQDNNNYEWRQAGTTRIENGLYTGLGLGIQYEDWSVDLMYKLNTGKVKGTIFNVESNNGHIKNVWTDNFSKDIRNSRVTLSVTYKFDL